MSIQMSQQDFDRLVGILSEHGEWQSVRGRIDFILAVFAGSPRKADILGQLDLDGNPRNTAVRVIQRLSTFGQDEPGRESLGVLINKLIAYLGGGDNPDFLRILLSRYSFTTRPVVARAVGTWYGSENADGVHEKIIGENTLRDVFMLEVLFELSRAVVRISSPEGLGTGFLVSEDLIMTNHHVIDSDIVARKCEFNFNYQLDREGKAMPVHTSRALVDGLFHTSAMASLNASTSDLDYTVVQVADVPAGISPMTFKPAAPRRDSRLTIIQHPGGGYKKISLQNNFVEYVDESVVQYTTSTEPGSSGSPVLSDDFVVVAIHHAGGNISEPATRRRYLRNEGILASAILDDLRRNALPIFERVSR